MARTKGSKFWLQEVTEFKNRGVADIFLACVDGLKGFPDAIEAVFPKTTVRLCLVHMVRHSLNCVGWKQRKEVAAAACGIRRQVGCVVRTEKIIKTLGSFPTDEAVFKLFYQTLKNFSQKWTMPIRDWKAALDRFTIQFDERMPRV